MAVRINKQTDEVFVKQNGAWNKETDFAFIVGKPVDDPTPVATEEQIKQQKVNTLREQVKQAIAEMKEKKEIFDLGGCDQPEYGKKVTAYKTIKAEYEAAKAA